MSTLSALKRKFLLSIGRGLVKLVDDARELQHVQVTALKDEVRDKVRRYQDYGFTSNPLDGAEALLAAIGGNRSHLVVVRCDDGRYRKKNLARGEVAIYHHEGGYIHFKNGKQIDIVMPAGKVNVTCPEVTVTASVKLKLDTPTVECTGALTAQGNVTSQGTVQGNSVRTASGKVLETHTHPVVGVQGGGSTVVSQAPT